MNKAMRERLAKVFGEDDDGRLEMDGFTIIDLHDELSYETKGGKVTLYRLDKNEIERLYPRQRVGGLRR